MVSFRSTDVSVLFSENRGNRDFGHQKNTKAPEVVTIGAGSRAVVGGTLGWLAGIGTLTIPGLGAFVAAGPIAGLLSGVGASGALGGITGALIGAGMTECVAKRYEGRILEETGAQDISSNSEAKADLAASR